MPCLFKSFARALRETINGTLLVRESMAPKLLTEVNSVDPLSERGGGGGVGGESMGKNILLRLAGREGMGAGMQATSMNNRRQAKTERAILC